eukprot:1924495-Lingulodinium_polyedra.AAC.1
MSQLAFGVGPRRRGHDSARLECTNSGIVRRRRGPRLGWGVGRNCRRPHLQGDAQSSNYAR